MGGIGVDRRRSRPSSGCTTPASIDDSGHIDNEGGTRGIDSRFFYSRLIADYWDAKAGVQFTVFDQGVTRSGFIAGVEGVAPYGIHLDAVLGVSQTGVVSARLDATYDILLSQKLIAQPFAEAMLASQDDPAIQLGSGLARWEVGLRLRYEIAKEFAPYVGVSFEQFTGTTASFVAAEGGADLQPARAGRAEGMVLIYSNILEIRLTGGDGAAYLGGRMRSSMTPPPAWKPWAIRPGSRSTARWCGPARRAWRSARLQDRLDIAASTLSHHLKALIGVGLVTQTREGRR